MDGSKDFKIVFSADMYNILTVFICEKLFSKGLSLKYVDVAKS